MPLTALLTQFPIEVSHWVKGMGKAVKQPVCDARLKWCTCHVKCLLHKRMKKSHMLPKKLPVGGTFVSMKVLFACVGCRCTSCLRLFVKEQLLGEALEHNKD